MFDGIEASEERAELAARHYRTIHVGGFETMPPTPLGYDVVLFLDVLEHLVDPNAAMRWATERIAPGGAVIALIPNGAHFTARLKIARGDWSYTDTGLFDRDHVRFFDLSTMGQVADGSGLEEVSRQLFGNFPLVEASPKEPGPVAEPVRLPRLDRMASSRAAHTVTALARPHTDHAPPSPAPTLDSEHRSGGATHDLQIEAEALAPQVVEVVLELLKGVTLVAGVPVLDLGPAGEAGADDVAQVVERELLHQLGNVPGLLGPGADQAQITTDDVPHLGQLVEVREPQDTSEAGDAWVLLGRPVRGARGSSRMERNLKIRKTAPPRPTRGWV